MQSGGNKGTPVCDKISAVMQFAGTAFCVVVILY